MRTLRVFAFLAFVYNAPAANLDSLRAAWNNPDLPDSIRVQALNTLAWDGYVFTRPDSAFRLAARAWAFAEQHGLRRQMAEAARIQGVSFAVRSEHARAQAYFEKGLALLRGLGDRRGEAAILGNMAINFQHTGDFARSLDLQNQSLAIMEEFADTLGMAKVHHNIGVIFSEQGDYPRSIDHYRQAMRLYELLGDERLTVQTLNNIGSLYDVQGDTARALEYYTRSLSIKERINDRYGVAAALVNIGEVYLNQGKYEEAMPRLSRSLQIYREVSDKRGEALVLHNLGVLHEFKGDHEQAIKYLKEAMALREMVSDRVGLSSTANNLGGIANKLGRYADAVTWCLKGLAVADEIGTLLEQRESCNCLHQAYKGLHDEVNALAYHERMQVVEDSLRSVETAKKLERMEFARQVQADSAAHAEEALRTAQAHASELRGKTRTRNLLGAAGVLLLALAFAVYRRNVHIRHSRTAIAREKERSENLLQNILPADIADELKEKGEATAHRFEQVSVLFCDFENFTEKAGRLSPEALVDELNACFRAFDAIIARHGIEKIKTIGDAYMAAGGIPRATPDSAKHTVLAALEMIAFMRSRQAEREAAGLVAFAMRAGIHSGPVVAGIVGTSKFQYDLWGDTVNLAARMEKHSETGRVNISCDTYDLLKGDPAFIFESRGKISVKGKGEVEMHFVGLKAVKG